MPYHDQKEAWLRSRAAFHKRQGGEIENEDDDLEVVSSKGAQLRFIERIVARQPHTGPAISKLDVWLGQAKRPACLFRKDTELSWLQLLRQINYEMIEKLGY